MSNQQRVLTVVGADRPGLVDTVSEYVFTRGGNVESTRAAVLGGEFAMILLIRGAADAVAAIEADAADLAARAELAVTVHPAGDLNEKAAATGAMPYVLSVHAMDHPGIVRAITHELADEGVNIRSLDTAVESAPHTGTAFFHFRARLDVPAAVNIAAFRARLARQAEKLNVDVQLTAAEEPLT